MKLKKNVQHEFMVCDLVHNCMLFVLHRSACVKQKTCLEWKKV